MAARQRDVYPASADSYKWGGNEWMGPEYDIFEKTADGSLRLHAHAEGKENALHKLRVLGSVSKHEFYAVQVGSNSILATVNVPGSAWDAASVNGADD
jgi:hypothetical protein